MGAIQTVMDAAELQQAMQEVRSATGINTYLLVSLEDDGTLFPYLFNLYFDLRCERQDSYVVLKTNFVPVSGDFLSGNYKVKFDFELSDDLQHFSDALSKVSASLNQLFPSIDFQSRASSLQEQVKNTLLSLKDVFLNKQQTQEDAGIAPELLVEINGIHYGHGSVCYIPKEKTSGQIVNPVLLHDTLLMDSLRWKGLIQTGSLFVPEQSFVQDSSVHTISFSYKGLLCVVELKPVNEARLAILHDRSLYHHRDTIFIDHAYPEKNQSDTIRMYACDVIGKIKEGGFWNIGTDANGAFVLARSVSSIPLVVEYRNGDQWMRVFLVRQVVSDLKPVEKNRDGLQKIGPLYVDLGRRSARSGGFRSETLVLNYDRTAFDVTLNNEVFSEVKFSLENIPLEVKVGRDNGFDDIRYAEFKWESNDGLPAGKIGFFDAFITDVDLRVDSLSKLSGSLTFSVSLDQDTRITENLVVKQNLSGACSFVFDQGDLRGSFDFSGIENLQMDYVAGTNTLAELRQTTVSSEGLVSGYLQGIRGKRFQSNGFVLAVEELMLEMEYRLGSSRMHKLNGDGVFVISDISGLKGELWIHSTYVNNNVVTIPDKERSSLSLYGFHFSACDMLVEADSSSLGIVAINGSAVLRHPQTKTRIYLDQIDIASGALMSLRATGDLIYRNYYFSLIESDYQRDRGITMSAHLMVDQNEVFVSDISVDTAGQVSIAAISGSFKKHHVTADFTLEMLESGLAGDFDARFLHMGLQGSLLLGTDSLPQGGSGTSSTGLYNYGYFGLTVSGVMPGFIPGTRLTRLGGQFGFHTKMQLQSGKLLVSPEYGSYMAGFSLGIADVSGLVELAADPVLFQFGSNDISLFLRGEMLMPHRKPVFEGSLNLYYTYPANVFEGSLAARVSIPNQSGFVLRTVGDNRIDFFYSSNQIKIETSDLYAEMFRAGVFSGSMSYSLRKNPETGATLGRSGHLNGRFEASFESTYSKSFLADLASIDAVLDMGVKAEILSHFDEVSFSGTYGYEMHVDAKGTASFTGGSVSVEAGAFNSGTVTVNTSSLAMEAMLALTFKCYTNGDPEGGFSRSFNQYMNLKIDKNGNKTFAFAENKE